MTKRLPGFKPTLIGLPFDVNSSFMQGPAEAPAKIREALFSDASHLWSEAGINLDTELQDAGDVVAGGDMNAAIETSIANLLEQNSLPLSLGGDHAVTLPIMRAFAQKYSRLSILHFDAHPDLYEEFQGNRYSHACPFARIMEEGLVQRLVQVGIRTLNEHQRMQVKRFGVEVIEMKDWSDNRAFQFDDPVYISLDLDGLDPAFAPGVSHREPGGLSTRQVLNVIQNLKGRLVGSDLVEYNPRMDQLGVTATVCAKLAKELAARMLTDN